MNPLHDILPAKARKVVYGILSLALLVFTIFQASAGDWDQFVGGLLLALTTGTAASNTAVTPEKAPVGVQYRPDDDAPVPDDPFGIDHDDRHKPDPLY